MTPRFAIGILFAACACIGSPLLLSQDLASGNWRLPFIPEGEVVYDTVNNVTWLADADLPADKRFRFGLPLCDGSETGTTLCMYASGAMNYVSATAWIAALNASNYLGHSDWQLPTTPFRDHDCPQRGPSDESFGFGCDSGAFGYLYYTAFRLKAPNTAVPIPPNRVGPFRNFQPNLYWSDSGAGGLSGNIAAFSFASGAQDGSTEKDFLDVLPMIQGKIPGTPPAEDTKLQVNPDRQTVYDPVAGVTWLADANLAASAHDLLGLPLCETPTTPMYCVARDGSMNYASANQLINNMNGYDHGAGYLGQTNWQLPPVDPKCPTYNCDGKHNPMGELFYDQFGLSAGEPVVEPPNIPVGPFRHLLPFHYWTCVGDTIPDVCGPDDLNLPGNPLSEFGFSFANGYLGTARLPADHFVTAYFPGRDFHEPWGFAAPR